METSVQLQQLQGEVDRSRWGERKSRTRKRVGGIGAQLPADHLRPCRENSSVLNKAAKTRMTECFDV